MLFLVGFEIVSPRYCQYAGKDGLARVRKGDPCWAA